MELNIIEFKNCALLHIEGRIDSYSASRVDSTLNQLVEDGQYNLLLDMQDVTYISSSGMLTLVNWQKKLQQKSRGEIALATIPELVLSSFELAGFDQLFKIYSNSDLAVESFGKGKHA